MKKFAILFIAVLIGFTATAQTQNVKTASVSKNEAGTSAPTTIQKIVIQTNGVCSKCEALFKEQVPFFKGVKDYTYDSKTSKMTIAFDPKKTNPDLLRQQISKLGYNADNVKADPAARAKLPACCRVDKKPEQHSGCCGNAEKTGGCCDHNHGQCKEKSASKPAGK